MTSFARVTLFFAFLLSSAFANNRTPITVLGAFHNTAEETIVFSVHYLRDLHTKESTVMPAMGVYLKINGKKYPLSLQSSTMTESRTGGRNVIEEYTVRGYTVNFDEIPNLRNAKSVIFGLDYTVNDEPIKLEKEVSIIDFPTQVEANKED